MDDPISRLSEYFSQFPGIGPRQAKRFVYFLLAKGTPFCTGLENALREIRHSVAQCASCFRFFRKNKSGQSPADSFGHPSLLCDICSGAHTDASLLLVVEKDADFENIRKSGNWNGRYFILGGSLPILEKEPSKKIRARELFDLVQNRAREKNGENGETPEPALKEIVLAMSATAEGENTLAYVSKILEPLAQKYSLNITALGRGLSTGTEIEYSDAETFKSALANRKKSL